MQEATGGRPTGKPASHAAPRYHGLVWDLPVRLFHWLLVACVATAWWTGGSGERIHEIVGYSVAGLIGFRIVWGFIGTDHARFADFVRSPLSILAYLYRVLRNCAPRHVGHNPPGGAMILALIAVLIGLAVTGAMMQSDAFFGIMWVETTHIYFSNAILVLVPLHVLGVLIASLSHNENLLWSMVTGRKLIRSTDTDSNRDQSHFILQRIRGAEGLVLFVLALSIGTAYGYSSTMGRKAVVETKPPKEAAPSLLETSLTRKIREEARPGHEQDYVQGGPAITSRAWLISSGGRLYDNWFKALGKKPPNRPHPLWPAHVKAPSNGETWRCKACHGWDYLGNFGQNRRGPGATGIRGVQRMRRRPVREIINILNGRRHAYTNDILPTHAKYRLALFISEGQHTIGRYIRANGKARGIPELGRALFQNVCAACHGFDGKARRLGASKSPTYKGPPLYVGTKASKNPVEVFHKVRNGHPGAIMVSLRPFPISYATHLLAYVQTLPTE